MSDKKVKIDGAVELSDIPTDDFLDELEELLEKHSDSYYFDWETFD